MELTKEQAARWKRREWSLSEIDQILDLALSASEARRLLDEVNNYYRQAFTADLKGRIDALLSQGQKS